MSATATKERKSEIGKAALEGGAKQTQRTESPKKASQRRRRAAAESLSAAQSTASTAEAPAKKRGSRSKELGRKGEDAAERYLVHRGYEILERNWTCFAGEADIIAKDGRCLVFVEVKTRRNTDKGFPSEAVNAKKRERYEKIALAYASEFHDADIQVRFDVVSIVVIGKDKAMIRHHLNAFTR